MIHLLRIKALIAALCASLASFGTAAQLAESDFSLGDEGWTSGGNGGAPIQHFGSYIAQQDIDGQGMAFVAPASYLTSVGAGYRGQLSFELLTSQMRFAPSRPRVELTGLTSGGMLTLRFELPPPFRADVFVKHTVKLVESQPWEVVGQSRVPTSLEFREIMGALTDLRIVCDNEQVQDELAALDNVRLDPARVRVFILAGQSNMSGCNDVRTLDPVWQETLHEVMLYWDLQDPNPGFLPLTTGSSTAPCSNPAPAFYFGPELAFGRELASLYPDEQCLLIKYAVGGTDLFSQWTTPTGPNGEFPNGGPLWNQLKLTIDNALAGLLAAGYEYNVEAFLWMQGESDADKQFRANAYASKLTNFIASMRSHTAKPNLPFILARIRDAGQPHAATVRAAQVNVANAQPWTCWFDTDDLPFLPDGIHYDDPSMIVLGQRFADRLYVFLDPRGDVNRDGRADIEDLYAWTQNPVDLNCNGLADQADMEIVIDAVRAGE